MGQPAGSSRYAGAQAVQPTRCTAHRAGGVVRGGGAGGKDAQQCVVHSHPGEVGGVGVEDLQGGGRAGRGVGRGRAAGQASPRAAAPRPQDMDACAARARPRSPAASTGQAAVPTARPPTTPPSILKPASVAPGLTGEASAALLAPRACGVGVWVMVRCGSNEQKEGARRPRACGRLPLGDGAPCLGRRAGRPRRSRPLAPPSHPPPAATPARPWEPSRQCCQTGHPRWPAQRCRRRPRSRRWGRRRP